MIANDRELRTTMERIAWFQEQALHLRQTEFNPVNYRAAVSGFHGEIDRMQLEVREYLSVHPRELAGDQGAVPARQTKDEGEPARSEGLTGHGDGFLGAAGVLSLGSLGLTVVGACRSRIGWRLVRTRIVFTVSRFPIAASAPPNCVTAHSYRTTATGVSPRPTV